MNLRINVMLLSLISILNVLPQVKANDILMGDESTINWRNVIVIKNEWPVLPKPSLGLGSGFVFNHNNADLPEDFKMMVSEVSCHNLLKANVLTSLREQDVRDLCEYGMDEAVTGISYIEALRFCQINGANLPSEAQWVYVASLVEMSWLRDHKVVGDLVVPEIDTLLSSFKEDVSDAELGPLGIKGLFGNVWEMTRTPWGAEHNQFIIKGGAFDLANKPWLMHPYFRAAFNGNDIHNQNIGFRCVK